MMNRTAFFSQLWDQYVAVTPQAKEIHALFKSHSTNVINDHVAFRSIAIAGFDLDDAATCFAPLGYEVFDRYQFEDKHLDALAFWVPGDPAAPKIFFSALRRGVFSPSVEVIIDRLVAPMAGSQLTLESLCGSYPFATPSWRDYLALAEESEYAAWLSTMGYQANHFTVSLNHLTGQPEMAEVIEWVQDAGYALNEVGGLIKGTPDNLLVQASTLADRAPFRFAAGDTHEVPSCFYEFARRYQGNDGALFQGFIPANANTIFESTRRMR